VQKRILDAINRKIAEGTEVIYIPGNHDIELRQMGLFGKTILGMRFEKSLDLIDPKGRLLLITHGDSFDAMEEKNIHAKMPPVLYRIGDRLNLLFNKAGATADKVADRLLGRPLTLIGRSRHAAEKLLGSQRKRVQALADYARKNGYKGVVCGHFHVEAIKEQKDGVLYLNSGDWVVNFTALTLDKNGDWGLVRWPQKRRELGLKRSWRIAANDNPDKGFRPATEDMLKAIREIWPGRDKRSPKPPKP
jgi:UDP-2,3-diacylglucosamine pyrophosphatase LpxH